jgi:hypothetical protein
LTPGEKKGLFLTSEILPVLARAGTDGVPFWDAQGQPSSGVMENLKHNWGLSAQGIPQFASESARGILTEPSPLQRAFMPRQPMQAH